MSGPVNVRDLAVGTRLTLATGEQAEVVDNPRDGVWLFARYISADDPAMVGTQEMIFAQDVVAIQS